MNKHTFRCALGKHEYSENTSKDKINGSVHMCIHCNLHGYFKSPAIGDIYIEYYPNGYCKREVFSDEEAESIYHPNGRLKSSLYKDGRIKHYNKSGVCIYSNHKNGTEKWLHRGIWYSYRPKKWNPENEKTKNWR